MNKEEFKEKCNLRLQHIDALYMGRRIMIIGDEIGGVIASEWLLSRGYKIHKVIKRCNDISSFINGDLTVEERIDPSSDFVVVANLYFDIGVSCLLSKRGFKTSDYIEISRIEIVKNKKGAFYKGVEVGRMTYGYDALLTDVDKIFVKRIGSFCSINYTARVCINHPIDAVSTHLFTYTPIEGVEYPLNGNIDYLINKIVPKKQIVIGNDVWVGANVVILPNVSIGTGAILAAGAVVTRDVESYQIVGGVPAKPIGYRIEKELIPDMLKTKWWDWDIDTIISRHADFRNPRTFIEKYGA